MFVHDEMKARPIRGLTRQQNGTCAKSSYSYLKAICSPRKVFRVKNTNVLYEVFFFCTM